MSQQATIFVARYWTINDVPVPEEMQFIYDPLDGRSHPLPSNMWAAQLPTIQAAIDNGVLASFDGRPIDVVKNLWCPMFRSVSLYGPAVRYDGKDAIWDPNAQGAIDDWDWLRLPHRRDIEQLTVKQYTEMVKLYDQKNLEPVRDCFEQMAKVHNEKRELVASLFDGDYRAAEALVGEAVTGPELMYRATGDI